MSIFDETALRKLEQLALIADKVRAGIMKGDRRSKKRGTSIEFADYRNYVKGDDLRRLDWNVYARLERPFIKLLEEEEDLAVHVLIDSSLSMNWPDGLDDLNKLIYAARLAGALGHVALAAGDLLSVTVLRSDGNHTWGPHRGKHSSMRLFQFLEATAQEAVGVTDLNLSLKNYALRGRRPGLLFVITDLMSPSGYQDGLNALQRKGYEVGVIHLLSPDELEPDLVGDYKLIDAETGLEAEITLDATTLEEYRERILQWQTEVASYCGGRGVHYVPVITTRPWEQLVMQTLRAQGILK